LKPEIENDAEIPVSTAVTAPRAPIITTKVNGRRKLRFTTLDDILADAERLTAGQARQLGNWSLGQATGHLARAMKMSLDGTTLGRAPLPIRVLLRYVFKKRILTKGMRPGFNLKGPFADYIIPDAACTSEQGLADLRTGIERLKREPQRHPHPAFGPLTREEWDQLHLRHAELHLSFFVPQ
jgi:hypothetical protein